MTSRAAEVTLLVWARLPSHQQRSGIVSRATAVGHKDIEAFLFGDAMDDKNLRHGQAEVGLDLPHKPTPRRRKGPTSGWVARVRVAKVCPRTSRPFRDCAKK